MKQSEYKYLFIVFNVEGLEAPLSYRVPESQYEKLNELFCSERDIAYFDQPIIRFQTSTDLEVVINLNCIQYVRFLWEPMKNHILNEEEKDEDSDSVKIYLKNLAEPLSITVGDPASFAKFINKLDNYKVLNKFFNFKDTDDEDISINLAHLQLVETNRPFLDKCQEILLNETIESLDMKIATKKKH